MTILTPFIRKVAMLLMLGILPWSSALAQTFPSKPIRLVVPYPPGGGADGNARLLSQPMATILGQPIVVENKPGASGILAATNVLQSPADGYTLLFDTFPYVVNAVMHKLSFDPVKDLIPVSQAINMPLILVVPSDTPFKTLQELMTYAKANPGKLNYASYGAGGAAHLAAEMLGRDAGIDWVHVPYKGGAPAMADVLAGRVSAYFTNPITGLAHIKSGKIRPLATTGLQRMQVLPDVPTIAESGYKDFDVVEWNGFFVPKGTPEDVIQKLAQAIKAATQAPEVRKRMIDTGVEPVGNSPKEFAAFLQAQITKWGALVKTNNIKAD
ncbi:tripartite tricarboxylate transporter substrate binding protein [Orrella sp. NBD-18]|uniref:Tripartite tricarboxylate transporter substrate binding protein n=1 Tax=Sheuella amnicola TaxID=2707330 RepID=A0A6B2R0R3_9BURK|nr:tripartite tricarboxylate transporter substrate binding protein [Sheuella amnicola]NDY82587.1 tripartite tricarboxylate transporter substrate binding protein [Sheuella amnicola]HBI82680.1 LacI family transcriptional regulator [Alcaligenaceae bacterium]